MPLETVPQSTPSRWDTFGPTISKNIRRFARLQRWEDFTGQLDRIMRAYYDVQDNFPATAAPLEYTVTKDSVAPEVFGVSQERFKELYAPRELMDKIFELFPEHGTYENHDAVGSRDEGTGHGHRYVIERFATEGAGETARIFFIDPEHHVGEKNFFRPAILNLMAMEVSEDLAEFELRTLRMRTETLDERVLNSFPKLKALAELMLKNNITADDLESLDIDPKEVIYFAGADADATSVMSRYTGENGIKAIHSDALLPRFILGKTLSHQELLKRIINKASAGKYRVKEVETQH